MRARPVDFRAKASLIALARAQCFRGARIIDRGPLVPNVFFVFARNQMTYINQSNAGSFLFLLSELLAVRIGSWAQPGFKINVLYRLPATGSHIYRDRLPAVSHI